LIEINIFDANNNLQNVEENRTTNKILAMLREDMIKEFHRLLKRGTSQERINCFRVGDYKAKPNMVGDTAAARPGKVAQEIG
jgi:hypothetical protein